MKRSDTTIGRSARQTAATVLALLMLSAGGNVIPSAAAAAEQTAADSGDVVAESDDIRALVAPVALYPDPILALVLQASTLPLQVVQAERFLDKRAKDASLQLDPDWDKSIIGLLNYPRQVQSMAEYIDWTEELGNAVIDKLDDVQSAIQDIRLEAYQAGFLKSSDRQKVEVKDDTVRITSTDPKKVSIPQYDPAALLTALDEVEEYEEAADEAAAAPVAAAAAAPQQAAPGPAAAPAYAPTAAAPGEYVPAAAYPVTAPAIAYAEPENSFWESAATFGGGAIVGGLLGWGLTEAFNDDDDDDDDDDWDGDWDDDWDSDRVQEELRNRRDFVEERREDVLNARDERRDDRLQSREDRAERARNQLNERSVARGGKTAPAAGNALKTSGQATRARGKRDVKLPGAGKQAGVSDKVRQRGGATATANASKSGAAKLTPSKQKRKTATTGFAQKRPGKGIAASSGSTRQVRQESRRGSSSRVARQGGGQKRATKASFGRDGGGGGGGGIASNHRRGGGVKADSARGRASRGGGGGRGRNR
jgi:hypothetical protein